MVPFRRDPSIRESARAPSRPGAPKEQPPVSTPTRRQREGGLGLPVEDIVAEGILLQASEGGQVALAGDVQERRGPHAVAVWTAVFKAI